MTVRNGFNGQKAYGKASIVYKLDRKKKNIEKKIIFHLFINRLLKYGTFKLKNEGSRDTET